MRFKHLSLWICAAKQEEYPNPGNWEKFVDIIQADFSGGELALQCAWQTVVMIPKGVSTNFMGVGLVEVLRKAIYGIIIKSSIAVYRLPSSSNMLCMDFSRGEERGPPPLRKSYFNR